jgi:competence protein ComEC
MQRSPQVYARPLIPVLLAFMAGITMGLYGPGLPGMFLAVFLVLVGCILFLWKGRKAHLPPLILFFLLGYWSLQGWMAPGLPPNHVTRFIDNHPWHIMGQLDGDAECTLDRTRFTLKVKSLTRKLVCYPATGAIRVTVFGKVDHLHSGDKVACLAKLKEIRNFNNLGGFNYKRYMASRGIRASAYVSKQEFLVRLHASETGWLAEGLRRARRAVSSLIERVPPQDAKGLMKALMIGQRGAISAKNREIFSRAGISHLLAISGLHIGMVATLAFFAFRYLLARSQRILLAAWASRGAALMSAAPVVCYGLLAGMSPPTQRAVIMVMAFLVALLLEREHDPLNALVVAALIILIINPTTLFEISFQLSFVAVFAILYTLRRLPLVSKFRTGPLTAWKRLTLFVLVSAAAILGTLPITLYYFNQASLIGLVTNCLLVPLVGFLVVPLGLLAVFLLLFTPTGSLWIMKTAVALMQGALSLATVFSKCPFAAVKTVTPTLLEIGLYYGLLWALFNFRKMRLAKALLLGIAVISLADAAYWVGQRFGREALKVTFIDVAQGSATLLELPGGPCMLVDGGGFYDNRFDVGARVVAPLLWHKKIATVETLVLSHPNSDHLNGLLFVAEHFNVETVWMNQEEVPSHIYHDFLKIISERDIRIAALKELRRPQSINGVRFQVLYPPEDFLQRKSQEPWRTPNNNSLVLKATFDNVSFLFPGDIEAEAEQDLLRLAGSNVKTTVLLVPHHGSKSSSTPEFLDYADPTIAVISAGWKNMFGFPHQQILRRYERQGCRIFRTDQKGAISITTDGMHLRVQPFLSDRVSL